MFCAALLCRVPAIDDAVNLYDALRASVKSDRKNFEIEPRTILTGALAVV
jgi:hypothetical protein